MAYHFHFNTFFHKPWDKELIEFYIYRVLRQIAFTLLSVFLPIFLYVDVGYSLFEILIFFLINSIIFLVFVPFSGWFIEKLGVKHALALHLPGLAIFTFLLRYLSGNFVADVWLIVVMLLIRSVLKSPMIAALNIFTSRHVVNKKGSEGSRLATIKIILTIAVLVSPIIGGVLIHLVGFDNFFFVVIALALLSAIPLFLTKDEKFHLNIKPQKIYSFTLHKLDKNFMKAEIGRWFPENIVWVVWPIFIYIVAQSTATMGAIISVASFIGIIVTRLVGKFIDRHKSKKLLKKSVNTYTAIFFLRTLIPTPIMLVITDAINKIVEPIVSVSYEKHYYKYLKDTKEPLERSVAGSLYLEIAFFLSTVFLVIIFGILELVSVEVTPIVFTILFLLHGIPILLMKNITKT